MTRQTAPTGGKTRSRPDAGAEKAPDTLEKQIEKQIGELLPQQQRSAIVQRVTQAVIQHEKFQGPIAHPRHLEAYEKILPGAAERIVRMAEKAQDHNIDMDQKVIDAEIADRKLGMYMGFASLALLVCLSAYAGMQGNNVLAGLLLTATVVGSVVAFIRGRNGTQ